LNVVTPISKATEVNVTSRVDVCCLLLLWLLGALAMSPVLMHPHWGMFSDPNQIVESCTVIFARGFDWKLWQQNMWVDFRPGFHLLDLLTWSISPHNPAGFYILRFFCFAGTLSLTYLNCTVLKASRVVSFCCSLFWFLAYPTYEVIYTLDKGEIYLGLLFALFVYGNIAAVRAISENSMTAMKASGYGFLLLFAAVCAIFTKQTGLLILGYSLVIFAVTAMFEMIRIANLSKTEDRNSGDFASTVGKLLKSNTLKWAALVASISMVAAAAFRIMFVSFGGLNFRYGEVVFTPTFLSNQLLVYIQSVPEFFLLYLMSGFLVLIILFKISTDRLQPDFSATQAVSLFITLLAGVFALCAWKSQVGYIWYPMFSLLLPLVAFSFNHLFGLSRMVPAIVFVCACVLLLPERISDAETQYNMDVVFNRFIARLSQLPQELGRNTSAVVKLKEQTSAELGEEIECAVREVNRLREVNARADNSVISNEPFNLNTYNIIRATSGNLAIDKTTLSEDVTYPADYKRAPGFDKFMYLPDQIPHWVARKIESGDIILIPYGNVAVKTAPYRGILCFAKPENALPESLLQLNLKPIMRISKSFSRFGGAKTEIGWLAFRVDASPTLSVPLADYGWFRNKQKIYYGAEQAGHLLSLDCEDVLAPSILVGASEHESMLVKFDETAHHLTISLPANKREVSVSGVSNFDKPVLFRVKKLVVQ
jgi:hypothetical protein